MDGTMNCDRVCEALEDALLYGGPLPQEARAHLDDCAGCRELARELGGLNAALLNGVPEIVPPPQLRARVLAAARRRSARPPARRSWTRPNWPLRNWAVGAGLAAALALAVVWPLRAGLASAGGLPDPAVVVALGDTLVVANNVAGAAPVSLVSPGGRVTPVKLDTPRPAWFTEGVRAGDLVYLADAGNDRVVVLNAVSGRVVAEYPMPGGVAGLAVVNGRVICKMADGSLGPLHGTMRQLAPEADMPLTDVMDAVAARGGTLYVTHHARGEVLLLDADTLAVRRRVQLGGAPVALAVTKGGVLALDTAGGALIWLNAAGDVTRRVALKGHPDKLVLSGDSAYVSDRAGQVTRVNLASGRQLSKTFDHPMDLATMPGGHLALADGGGGLKILSADLNVLRVYGR